MVLHHGQKNHVSFADELSAPRLRHQIDALGCAACEDDLVRTRRADILCDALPRAFISFGRTSTQCVKSAMNIRIVVFVEISQRLDDGARLLRTRSAIKVD